MNLISTDGSIAKLLIIPNEKQAVEIILNPRYSFKIYNLYLFTIIKIKEIITNGCANIVGDKGAKRDKARIKLFILKIYLLIGIYER